VKAVVLLLLSALTAAGTDMLAHGGTFTVGPTVGNFLLTFVIAVGVHYGLLKPIGVTGSLGRIADAVPGGIGPSRIL
jgi:beta-galactosidase GanA